MQGCDLKNEKELKKDGRGSYYYKIEKDSKISAVRWYDNRTVSLLSYTQHSIPRVKQLNRTKRKYKKK